MYFFAKKSSHTQATAFRESVEEKVSEFFKPASILDLLDTKLQCVIGVSIVLSAYARKLL